MESDSFGGWKRLLFWFLKGSTGLKEYVREEKKYIHEKENRKSAKVALARIDFQIRVVYEGNATGYFRNVLR